MPLSPGDAACRGPPCSSGLAAGMEAELWIVPVSDWDVGARLPRSRAGNAVGEAKNIITIFSPTYQLLYFIALR